MAQEELCPSRRTVLAATALAVALPVLQGTGAAALAADGAEAAGTDGWVATVTPKELVDGTFRKGFEKFKFVLARDGKNVYALSTKCTHKGCTVKAFDPAHLAVLVCPCHGARYDIAGTPVRRPATQKLARYPLRLSATGVIEVDISHKVADDDKSATLNVPDGDNQK